MCVYTNKFAVVVDDNWCPLGQDYGSGPYTVVFPAGETSIQFNVTITSDDVYERNETFQLTIDSLSLPLNVTTAELDQATVIIINDDCKYIKYYVWLKCVISIEFFLC